MDEATTAITGNNMSPADIKESRFVPMDAPNVAKPLAQEKIASSSFSCHYGSPQRFALDAPGTREAF